MKKIDKIILAIFSILMLFESIIVTCLIVGWIKVGTVETVLTSVIANEQVSRIILVLAIICFICSIKCIFFESTDKEKSQSGVLMQNDNGKLLISKATIENIVKSVVKDFENIKDVKVSISLDKLNNLIVNVYLIVNKNVIIKELTLNIQNKIKEEIKKTSDLEVKEVNVKIKDIISDKNWVGHESEEYGIYIINIKINNYIFDIQ